MSTSNCSGRVKRTMDSAFGPYTCRELYAPPDPRHERSKAMAAILATLGTFAALGVILAWRV